MKHSLSVAVLVVAALAARAGDVAPQKVATVEGITEYRLANGPACCSSPSRRGRPSPST